MQTPPSLHTMTMNAVRRSKIVRTVTMLTHLAALLVVAAGLGAPQALAWDQKNLVPPAPLNDPPFPVLPGGVVGPALDAGTGSATEAELPGTAHQTASDTTPSRQQAPLVPPPAETWEQAVESNARLTGKKTPNETDDVRSQRRRVGIALGAVGALGILAVMAALRGANPRLPSKSPMSVLHSRATDMHRPRKADHERSKRLDVQQVATRVSSQNA